MKYTNQHCKSFDFNVWHDRVDYAGKNALTSKNKCHLL